MQRSVVKGVPELGRVDQRVVVSLEDELGGLALVGQDPLEQEGCLQRQVGEAIDEVVLDDVVVLSVLLLQQRL